MPTMAALTRISVPPGFRNMEGVSLLPILNDPVNGYVKDVAMSQYPRGKSGARVMGYSARSVRYRTTNWIKFKESYDYLTDEWETRIQPNALAATKPVAGKVPFDWSEISSMRSKAFPVFP
jgi:hypothetical protein